LQKIDACPDEAHPYDGKQDEKVGISGVEVKPEPSNAEEQANRPECGIELLLSQSDNLNDDQAQPQDHHPGNSGEHIIVVAVREQKSHRKLGRDKQQYSRDG